MVTLTPAQQARANDINATNAASGINDAVNPEYVVWLDRGQTYQKAPPYYAKDAQTESQATIDARNAENAKKDAALAADQKKLADSYAATQKAAGTTHAKNTAPVTNNGKTASQIATQNKSVKPTQKATVVSAQDNQAQKNAAAAAKQAEADRAADQARQASAAKKSAEQEAVAKQKSAAQARAAAQKSADAEIKANAERAQKEADAAQARVKVAQDAAAKTAKYANTAGEAAHYANIAVATGSILAAKKAAEASKNIAVTAAQADAAVGKAKSLGISGHEGQILLKDGTYINQVERKGSKGVGEAGVSVFTESAKERTATKRAAAKKAADEAAKAAKEYKATIDKAGNILAPIQTKGSTGTGELDVAFVSGKYRMTGKDARDLEATAKKVAKEVEAIEKTSLGFGTKSSVLDYDTKTGQLTVTGPDKKFSDIAAFSTVDQKKMNSAVGTALAEARKINPHGSKEYFDGVADVARRKQMSTIAVMKEDAAKIDTQLAKAIAPILPDLDKIAKVRDGFLSGITVKVTQPKKETLEYTLSDVQKKYQAKVKGNMVTGGLLKFTEDEYNSLRTKPASYAGNAAAVFVGGEVLGAGVGALKLATKAGAGKVASKIASPVAKKALSLTGKHGVDAAMMAGMVGSVGVSTAVYFSDPAYKSLSQVDKDLAKVEYAAGMFRMGKDFLIGGIGFNKGAKEFEATASRIKAMKPTAGATIKPKSSGLENALPSEFDITNVAKSVKPAAPKTTAQRVTALKAQVTKLESKGKVSDRPKIRSLKRQINAVTLKSKNANALADMKPKNRADIKEIANDQAFDKELASLKEMQAFAERYSGSVLNKTKPTEADLGKALSKIGSAEKVQVSRIKRGLPETKVSTRAKKTTRTSYVKDTPSVLKSLATEAGKASTKKAKVAMSGTKTAVKDAMMPKIRKSVPGVAKYKDTSAQAMHSKLKLRMQAQRIETGLDKARVSGNVSKEVYYTAQAAKFKLTHGVSTEKAAKVYQFKAKTVKTLGQKRAEYSQIKAAHGVARKIRVSEDYTPEDITDIVKTAKAFESSPAGKAKIRQAVHGKQNKLLRDAAKDKKESKLPGDITNIASHRRAKGSASGKLTIKEVALFKAKNGSKYTTRNIGSLDTFKAEAGKFNKAAAERRTQAENKRAWAEAEAKAELEEVLSQVKTVSEPTRAEINRAAHDKAREQIRQARSQKREAEAEYKSSEEYSAKQGRHTQAREKVLRDRSAVREAKAESAKSEKAKNLQEKHDAASERIRVERSVRKEAPVSERARINQEAHAWAHEKLLQERAARKEAPISERAQANKKAHDEAHERLVRQRSAAREATREIEQALASVEKYTTEPVDKFKTAVSRTKVRNEEIRRSYGPESQARASDSGALKLLQKAESVVKAVEKHEKAREKRSLTVSEKRVVERAKGLRQQKARPRQRTAVEASLEEKQKVRVKQKPEVKAARPSRYFYAPGAGMDPHYIRYPVGATAPGIRNGTSSSIGFIPVQEVERTVKNIENTIYRMDNIVKQHMNNTVKQNIRVKPIVIVPTNIDSAIRPDVKPDVLVKPGVIVKPKVETILKPIVDQIEVIKNITVTPSAQGYRPKLRVPTDPVITAKRKKPEQPTKSKDHRGIVKLNRELRNKIGSIQSMFDLPSKKVTTKRAVKRVSRA